MIDLAGLLAAAVLLVTLVALDVRHAGPNGAQPVNARVLGRTVNTRAVVAVMWVAVVVLLFPRVLELLT
ncbi:hypothetical protein AB0284_18015 [Pseudarthrobacter phenanthrenivorans]|uniref:hypothetical protein n=1 Tax=Pseudarthrobacter phenanthrenivorans TaxID=361575 RepID=UPI00344C7442